MSLLSRINLLRFQKPRRYLLSYQSPEISKVVSISQVIPIARDPEKRRCKTATSHATPSQAPPRALLGVCSRRSRMRPPLRNHVGRTIADSSMPVSGRLPHVGLTTLAGQLSEGARTWQPEVDLTEQKLGNLAERANSGINSGDLAERMNSGTNSGDLADRVNSGTSPGDLAEKVNSDTNPMNLTKRANSSTNSGDLAERVNLGTNLRDLTEMVNSGTNPGDFAEKVNSGTNPEDLAERVNSGTSPGDLAEKVNSDTNPRDLAERVHTYFDIIIFI
ncbi:hypothetical protein BHE74_00057911 [Ensete ventricosum]|nr:hypothetical protein BHE74_00057911 [Ensete ventricosum]